MQTLLQANNLGKHGKLGYIVRLATNLAKKFTQGLFSDNDTRESIISHHINQKPCVEILHHLQRDLLHF